MTVQQVQSFAAGQWIVPGAGARPIRSAITGEVIAEAGGPLDPAAMIAFATEKGGPALRAMTFHDRAKMLKALALYLRERRQPLYDLSFHTGGTMADHRTDVDGGIGTMLVIASKGRREMPEGHVYLDGGVEQLSRNGTFLGQHICTPLQGVAIHINAFNFPIWGMLEKLAPTLLAGMPAIVKPATTSGYVAARAVEMMMDSGLLPEGAVQLVSGSAGGLLDHLGMQDVISFTGSAATADMLRGGVMGQGARFLAEQDSLNASILGPDALPGTPEFDLFIREATAEMTAKAGQKCTAIRRMIVPQDATEAVLDALKTNLAAITIGDPREKTTQMGALISTDQRDDVLAKAALIGAEAECVYSADAVPEDGAFMAPMLFHCADPDAAQTIHKTEAFGPVATVMGYRDLPHAITLANRGEGSLVTSLITHDTGVARDVALGIGSYHGRLYINDRTSMAEATGHGSPLPHMVHGGPGRAGGGEELGGIRGVMHYMQRTAVQASPDMLTAITGQWVPGAAEQTAPAHPFTRSFTDLQIGETLITDPRTVTLDDIEHFATFTGDTFYAHMDDAAAAANPFFPGRVAHGYLLLSFAAGLFVEPNVGPVLANTGLNTLRFQKPVSPGDAIHVRLTVRRKTRRTDTYGEVRWHVTLFNQDSDQVAEYELLTMNAY
ncbi:oxepin-CoA hydrolase/3-oxo-5,6-dehydrosuberyl-CoA semialdehyde dehydrogenase [Rubricella aquisinus]|uniref:Oxepin-CoA hydrolase/3-oxo-5,6-dehydrosuberyl-CoA semialdehyde dehydrogenase n=1 Tax=Rubricella aquisinus TaxID=2028108 RepID=A0A840WWV3_9RHOB|nr:phenylacetic acid degradation bifunctional protein PaaZ [Rubricella aquisinus]MBB5514186.1 oxepin-CoA hydrolase/3-oxo-5,6-dehydrosuberyl-CoA semialdehyde dehydrogenase [Rubricella aquisinus]